MSRLKERQRKREKRDRYLRERRREFIRIETARLRSLAEQWNKACDTGAPMVPGNRGEVVPMIAPLPFLMDKKLAELEVSTVSSPWARFKNWLRRIYGKIM